MMRTTIATILALSLAATASAQKVGAEAPEVPWAKTWNWDGMPSQKLSELRGSVVLLEFWGTH